MTLQQFRAKVYEMLEKHGSIEHNGGLYYPEAAVMELMEWFFENATDIADGKVEKMIADTLERAFKRIGQ